MPIRNQADMRRAIQRSVPSTPAARQRSELEIYMDRMRARMGGGRGATRTAAAVAAPAVAASAVAAPVRGSMGAYSVPGVGTFDAATGRMTQAAVRPASAAPGFGAPTPVVSPASRARAEAANQALQNAGGANISERILPGEDAVKAVGAYAEARAKDPFAEIPALVDQRSQEYGQRADIAAWIEANKNAPKGADGMNIVDRFLAKQRPAAPLQSQLSEAPDYSEGGAPTAPWTPADAPGPAPERGTVIGEKYYGKQWDGTQWIDEAQAPFSTSPLGTTAAYGMAQQGVEFVPQATAQASNLNFNSPLPEANMSQAFSDESKTLSEDLLRKYKLGVQGIAFNAG